MPTQQLPGTIAIIDVETTGLFPFRHDRVVELAAVVIDGEGQIVREFASLVNPGRDIGPSSIHGLSAEDVMHAPHFGEIAGLLVETLRGTVAIAGHNVRFDQQFLESEFSRLGAVAPRSFTLCTMELAGGGRLNDCCCDYGISLDGEAHHALADARATARLLSSLLSDQPRVVQTLRELAPIEWPYILSTEKRPITRDDSRRQQSAPSTFLQRLVVRMHAGADPVASEGAVMAYTALLDRALEDRHIDELEADALLETATNWGLSSEQIHYANREYLNQLAMAALADEVVTEAERRDLRLVARLLGQGERDLEQVLQEAMVRASFTSVTPPEKPAAEVSLSGKRVCFTGELQGRYDGQLIPRELAETMATRAGLEVVDSVTKRLDILVLADPHSQSGKAKKARQYGIRILHEPVFWRAIGVNVE
ncbi:MAG: exonuclease domain-containing protein [Thermoanaerobaculia bacterium]|nr:exonuclease domain-containing protein [Thermoanaerobaculia bacterium]